MNSKSDQLLFGLTAQLVAKHCTSIAQFMGSNPRGVLKKVLYGEAPPQGPTPYPFIYEEKKRHPFRIPFIGKRHPFHIPSKKT